MKYKTLLITLLFMAVFGIAPAAAQSQGDLELVTDSVFFDPALELAGGGDQVEVSFRLHELTGIDMSADVELVVNDDVVATESVSVSADEEQEGFVFWTIPEEGGTFDLILRLANQIPADENADNDLVSYFGVEISPLGAPLDPLAADTDEPESEETALTDSTESEPQVLVPLEDSVEPLFIHTERLNWNTYRFRPSFRLGQTDQEYIWNFSDGTTANKRIVEHTYAGPGAYPVRLEILEADGDRHTAEIITTVGFFNLANWRLWILLGLLALIIIVAAIVAGSDEGSKLPRHVKKDRSKTDDQAAGEETVINALSEESGDFDLLGEAGMTGKEFSDDLIFLEDLSSKNEVSEEKPKEAAVSEAKPTKVEVTSPKDEPAEKPKKKSSAKKKKKTSAKKTTKKKTTKKKPAKKTKKSS